VSLLYFGPSARRYTLDLVRAYSHGFTTHILSGFDDIEADADAAASAYFEEQMNQPTGYDGPYDDPGAVADDAQEHGFSVYSDLEFVRTEVTALAVAGLYHLWERLLKNFLVREFEPYDPPIATDKLRRAEFVILGDILIKHGWDIKGRDFYDDLDTLRLVANVVKHGDGKSCDDLLEKAPQMFHDFGNLCMNDRRGADHLELRKEDFLRFVAAVLGFFEQFPERLRREPVSGQ
jgi:hypothetical protein